MAQRKKKPAPPTSDAADVNEGADDDEEIIVLCHPVSAFAGVPGSRKLPCAGCGQLVWLSAATERHVAGKKHRVLCDECASKESGDDDVEMMPVAEGQIEEMLATIPGLTRSEIRKKFQSPAKRKAALAQLLREAQRRRRSKN